MKRLVLLPLFLIALALPALAQEADAPIAMPEGDSRIRTLLDELGYQYELDDDGDFRAVFEFQEDSRSQVVYVNSRTAEYQGLEIREVWSPAIESKGPFAPKVANRLLEASFAAPLGGWQMFKQANGRFVAVFSIKLPADANGPLLQTAINAVLSEADAMEKELTKKDTY
jgi:hypothetical protein